jgi:hypothetical protein
VTEPSSPLRPAAAQPRPGNIRPMPCLVTLALATLAVTPTLPARPAERAPHTRFTLYKMLNRIGVEDTVTSTTADTTELRTAFTDRRTTVPLA